MGMIIYVILLQWVNFYRRFFYYSFVFRQEHNLVLFATQSATLLQALEVKQKEKFRDSTTLKISISIVLLLRSCIPI